MLSDDCRFEGFDTESWINLLSLFHAQGKAKSAETALQNPRRGTLVMVVDEHNEACAGFVVGRGPVAAELLAEPDALRGLCDKLGVERAIVVREGAIEELTERAAARLDLEADYAEHWLTLLEAARELENEGALRVWPPRARRPLPSPAMLRRVVDLILPDERAIAIALWEGQELWTACAIERRNGVFTRIVGRELLLDWAGPLGGDYRRDHRVLARAISRSLAPLHLGVFGQRRRVEALLHEWSPGAWARAIATREIIVSPAPAYVHLAVGADAAHAAGRRARSWLEAIELAAVTSPLAQAARSRVEGLWRAGPLHALAEQIRRPRSRES